MGETLDSRAVLIAARRGWVAARDQAEHQIAAIDAALAIQDEASGAITDRLISVARLAQRLGKHKNTVRKWAERNGLIVWVRGRQYVLEDLLE